ncbi:MAG: 3-phosphoshikimate 1-carboxyvinyltransferase [Planctomycetota bacterium]
MSRTSIEVPGSKSMTQRALVIAALSSAGTPVELQRALICDDSHHLTAGLRALGCGVEWSDTSVRVTPAALRSSGEPISCGNAGTAVRFLSALSLLVEGPLTIDGNERMRQRPIAPLVDALQHLGVRGRYVHQPGMPPIELEREGITPREASVACSPSSQFASGLLLAAPRLEHGLRLTLEPPVVSRPYLEMTVAMMQRAGARDTVWLDEHTIMVPPAAYTATSLAIEPDWSSAAFVLAAAWIAGRDVEIPGLVPALHSLQGDAVFGEWIRQIDDARPGEDTLRFDLTDAPDLLPPLTAAALFAPVPVHISGAEHTRVKECDRLAVLARELRKLGAHIDERPDGFDLRPFTPAPGAGDGIELEPEDDHRMAMTFGLMRLRMPGLRIRNTECVTKSFPDFWTVLARIAG